MQEHARFHIADTAVAITEKVRTQMKMAVSAEPWIPVGKSEYSTVDTYIQYTITHGNLWMCLVIHFNF